MNLQDKKYSAFNLVKEMLETPEIVTNLDVSGIAKKGDLLKRQNYQFGPR